MKQNNRDLRVKGFTLIELIIVIAIIGILAGILAPTMATYYRKARIRDANADAKMVFNAAQTAAQTFIAKDRGSSVPSSLKGLVIISYTPGGTGSTRAVTTWDGGTTAPDIAENISEVVDTVNRTVSGASEICWTVCINNYIVCGAVAAKSGATDRVGYYTANKAQADDVVGKSYNDWLRDEVAHPDDVPGRTEACSLREVCMVYDHATFAP